MENQNFLKPQKGDYVLFLFRDERLVGRVLEVVSDDEFLVQVENFELLVLGKHLRLLKRGK